MLHDFAPLILDVNSKNKMKIPVSNEENSNVEICA